MPSERLYQDLAENSLGLMCVHDLTGLLLWVNRAVPDALGYPPQGAVGQNLASFVPPRFRAEFAAYLERIRSKGVDSGLLRLMAADGGERIWSYRNILIQASEGPRVLGHAVDITERVKAERELKLHKERFEGLFQDAPVAYLEIDRGGRIRRVNRAACALLGWTESELAGRTIWEFVDARQRESGRSAFKEVLGKATNRISEVLTVHGAGGRQRSVEMHVNAILGRHDEITGARCAMLDITERLRAEEQARLATMELEARVAERTAELLRSNAELQQFAYVISHDLQTPLRQVRSLLKESGEGRIDTSVAITERMSRLISSVLEYSVAAHSPLRPARRVDLGSVVQESLANLQAEIGERRATVEVGDLPVVLADPTALVQTFQNLIGNSLKYARSEGLLVRVSAVEECSQWIVSVEDNGPGVPENARESIFQAFRRLHGADYPGAGVGLAICRKLVERNGGRIWVEAAPGGGAIFRFSLPK